MLVTQLFFLWTEEVEGTLTAEQETIRNKNETANGSPANVIVLSGCRDAESSADSSETDKVTGNKKAAGALTHALREL